MSRISCTLACLVLLGCSPTLPTYQCSMDTDCNRAGQTGGTCVGAYCAYADSTCTSGLRYDTSARSGLASQCVNPVGTTCAAPSMMCSGVCTDVMSDNANCGTCGTQCTPGQYCQAGSCMGGACGSGQMMCGGVCTSVMSDNANCGSCGNACPSGQACNGTGKCAATCGAGFSPCGSACVNFKTDPTNCGTCGNVCPAPGACAAGYCETVSFPTSSSVLAGPDHPSGGALGTGALGFQANDSESQMYTRAGTVSRLVLEGVSIADHTAGCAVGLPNNFNIEVNGMVVGAFGFPGGSGTTHVINQLYSFSTITLTGSMTLSIVASTTVCPGGAYWTYLPGGTATLY